MKKTATHWLPGIVLLAVSVCIALFCYKDYGFAWDEGIQRLIGNTTYDYVFHNDQALKSIEYRDLGTGFELPLIFFEKWLGLHDIQEITQMRHLATHLFFLAGVFCGYVLALRLYKNQFIACMAFVLLAFHPRIYGHSYFNSKDIPFLAMFIISFLVCHIAFDKDRPRWYLTLGIVCGYTTSIRAMGIMLMPCMGMLFVADMYCAYIAGKRVKPVVRNLGLYVAGFCAMLYVLWPILWSDPLHYFAEEFGRLAHINWDGDVLFMGQTIKGSALPWTYVPVWFAISTPEVWLAAGIAGIAALIIAVIKYPKRFFANTNERQLLLYLVCFAGPVIMVIVLRSVNYDDWRHLYFIYPAFVLLALYPVAKLMTGNGRWLVYAAFTAQLVYTGLFLVSTHPFEYVYFNNLVSHKEEDLRHTYDLEYFGTGYRKAAEYILAHDNRPAVRLTTTLTGTLGANISILTRQQQQRIVLVQPNENPDYYITNFRTHPDDFIYPDVFYNYKVLNSTILRIYKTSK